MPYYVVLEIAISIHLMFLLIYSAFLEKYGIDHFNTSHVSINRCTGGHQPPAFTDFNTSHVSINQPLPASFHVQLSISIHLMFLLIAAITTFLESEDKISIHLMFLLIHDTRLIRPLLYLHFNTSHVSINHFTGFARPRSDRRISIHLMFLLI